MYERGIEHQDDYRKEKDESHMISHAMESHSEEERPKFSLKVLKNHKSPLYRQVHEAILIAKYQPIALNSKMEYNRCLLPRLGVLMGEKRMDEEKREEKKEDHQEEESLEENPKRKKITESNLGRKRRKIEKIIEAPLGPKVEVALKQCSQWKRKRSDPAGRQEESPAKFPRRFSTEQDEEEKVIKTPAKTPGQSRIEFSYKTPGKNAKKAENLTGPLKVQNSESQNARNLIYFFEKLSEKQKTKPKLEAKKMARNSARKKPRPKTKSSNVQVPAQAKIDSFFVKPSPPISNSSTSGPWIKKNERDPKLATTKAAGNEPSK